MRLRAVCVHSTRAGGSDGKSRRRRKTQGSSAGMRTEASTPNHHTSIFTHESVKQQRRCSQDWQNSLKKERFVDEITGKQRHWLQGRSLSESMSVLSRGSLDVADEHLEKRFSKPRLLKEKNPRNFACSCETEGCFTVGGWIVC